MAVVLIVDDDRSCGDSLRRYFAAAGIAARVARDGEAALAMMRERRPGVVVMDYSMSGRTGVEVLRAMRGEAGIADVPVVFYTAAVVSEERRAEALGELGAVGWVTKDGFGPGKLMEAVRGILNAEF